MQLDNYRQGYEGTSVQIRIHGLESVRGKISMHLQCTFNDYYKAESGEVL